MMMIWSSQSTHELFLLFPKHKNHFFHVNFKFRLHFSSEISFVICSSGSCSETSTLVCKNLPLFESEKWFWCLEILLHTSINYVENTNKKVMIIHQNISCRFLIIIATTCESKKFGHNSFLQKVNWTTDKTVRISLHLRLKCI